MTYDDLVEQAAFVPTVRRVALNRDVLAVATTRIEGTWKAYVKAVPGQNHDREQALVLDEGGALCEQVARTLFGCFEHLPYAG